MQNALSTAESLINEQNLSDIIDELRRVIYFSPENNQKLGVTIETLKKAINSLTENVKDNAELAPTIINFLNETILLKDLELIRKEFMSIKSKNTWELYSARSTKSMHEWLRDISIGVTSVNIARNVQLLSNVLLLLIVFAVSIN